MNWSDLSNCDLIAAAEANFDVRFTTDPGLRYQQNPNNRKLAILVLTSTAWPKLLPHAKQIVKIVSTVTAGQFLEFQP